MVDNVSINLFSSRVKELEEKNKALEEKLEENKEKWWALGKFTTDCGLCPHWSEKDKRYKHEENRSDSEDSVELVLE